MSTSSGVEFREQSAHFECCSIERAPDAADVVDDVFEEADSGVLLAMSEANFDEAAADPDDCARRPGGLFVAGVPEESEEPLGVFLLAEWGWNGG